MSARAYGALVGFLLAGACTRARAAGWKCPAEVGEGRSGTVRLELDWPGRRLPTLVASAGTLAPAEPTGRGHYAVTLALPHVAAPLELTVSASSTGSGSTTCALRVLPSARVPGRIHSAGPLQLSGPADLSLVENGTARIVARASALPPTLRVSAGTVFGWTREEDHWVARYEPPPERAPRVVLFAAVGADGALVDWLALPMSGVARVEAVTEPGASVRFQIGAESFGPVRTDAQGRATMAIRAPPGVLVGKAIATDRLGNVREQQVAVTAPPFQRLLAVCARSPGQVEWIAVDVQGQPERVGRLLLEVEGARVGTPAPRGPGHYVAPLWFDGSGAPVKVLARLADADPVGASCELPAVLVVQAAQPPVVLPAPPPPPKVERPSLRFTLAPRLGYAANAGVLSTAVLMVDGEARLARWPWVSVGLETGVAFRSAQRLDLSGAETVNGRYLLVPLLARASAELAAGSFALSAGPSAGVALVSAWERSPRIGSSQALRTLPSAGLHLAAERSLGAGSLVLEATYLHSFATGQPPLNGVFVTGGYRFGL